MLLHTQFGGIPFHLRARVQTPIENIARLRGVNYIIISFEAAGVNGVFRSFPSVTFVKYDRHKKIRRDKN